MPFLQPLFFSRAFGILSHWLTDSGGEIPNPSLTSSWTTGWTTNLNRYRYSFFSQTLSWPKHFTILKPLIFEINELYAKQKYQSTDLKALKL